MAYATSTWSTASPTPSPTPCNCVACSEESSDSRVPTPTLDSPSHPPCSAPSAPYCSYHATTTSCFGPPCWSPSLVSCGAASYWPCAATTCAGPKGLPADGPCLQDGPFRQGATVTLTPSADNTLCAVSALEYLLAASNGRPGPLFQSREGVPFTRPWLNTLIRELVSRTGRPPQQYSSHSFRIGAASTAAAAGIPDWRIQALGRWSSDCYRRYIRLPDADSAQITPTLAKSTL